MLYGEIQILEEIEPIMQHEVKNGVHGLTEVELSWSKCRNLMASAEKKVADAVATLVVSDMIMASISIE